MNNKNELIPIERVEQKILLIRGQKVILDSDLAMLYGVETKVLNQSIKRNFQRFPEDFMFQLTKEEKSVVVTNCDHLAYLKFSPYLPYAFTEHGAIMAASVLNSEKAVEMSIFVVRAFVKLRYFISTHKELSLKIAELERKTSTHDKQIIQIINAIKKLMSTPPPPPKKRKIGFIPEDLG